MAKVGCRYVAWCAAGESAGIVLGRMMEGNLTINTSSGSLYSDDALEIEIDDFNSADFALTTSSLDDATYAAIHGATVTTGTGAAGDVVDKITDTPPLAKLGYIQYIMRKGTNGVEKKYRAVCFYQAQAQLTNDNSSTKGQNVNFTGEQTNFKITADEDGQWRSRKELSSEDDAKAFVDDWCSI